MIFLFRRIIKLLPAALLVGCMTASADSKLTLADHGTSAYRIVLQPDAGPALRQAGDELAKYLSQATGASFPVVMGGEQAAGPAIRLRVRPQSTGTNPEAFTISSSGQDLLITGNSPRATLYGVYRLLEDAVGVHWFDANDARVPERRRLRVGIDTRRYAPRFAYREVFFRHADDPAFAAHNRLNGRFGHRLDKRLSRRLGGDRAIRQMSIFDLVPPDKYRSSHPEFYAGGQLRFASPGVHAAAKQQLRRVMASWDQPPDYLLIAHADRDTYYHGGADGKLIDRQGAPSAAFVAFVRDLAQMVADAHPDVTVLAQAYLWSRKPPQTEPLPDNMGVMLAGIERDFSKPLTAPANRGFLDDLDGWAELTSHIVIWDYVTDFAGYIQPYPNLHTLGVNMRALAERDAVEGVFAQGAYDTRGAAFAQLRTWLLARLLWDPQRDADALIEEFVTGYYGPAAPFIEDYIAALQAAAERWRGTLRDKMPPDAGYLDAQFLRRADKLFEHAESAVRGEPAYLRRVQTARIPVDYAILSNRDRLDGAGWVEPQRRLERLRHYLDQAHVTAYREGGGDIDSLMQALAIQRGETPPPAVCGQRPERDCIVVEDDGLQLAGGGAKLVPDDAAGDGGAVAMPGDTEAWGIQLPLADLLPEEGRWRIYVRARAEPAGGGKGAGLLIGTYPGEHRRVARADMAGSDYHSLRLAGIFSSQGRARYLWVAPPGDTAVDRILVDRIVAVRAEDN